MICKEIREELVAYQDGELAEQDRKHVAAHLSTCAACTQEAASLARVGKIFGSLERVMPSSDFSANFWQRLEQERQPQPENRVAQWWRELRESMTTWHLTPALVGVTSVLIFFAALGQRPDRTAPTVAPTPLITTEPGKVSKPVESKEPTVPAEVMEKSDLFIDYKIISELDRFARFEEIAAVDLSTEQPVEISETDIPKEVLDDPGFFAQYQILQQLERLKNLDAVLASPSQNDEEAKG
jgi:putative zinc finger protein